MLKHISMVYCPCSILMADVWTLGQGYLLLAQTMCLLYKQDRNTLETSC